MEKAFRRRLPREGLTASELEGGGTRTVRDGRGLLRLFTPRGESLRTVKRTVGPRQKKGRIKKTGSVRKSLFAL